MTISILKHVALPVLLIEDEPSVADYVRTVLEHHGYAVVCSTSGADGERLGCAHLFSCSHEATMIHGTCKVRTK